MTEKQQRKKLATAKAIAERCRSADKKPARWVRVFLEREAAAQQLRKVG